MMIDSETGLVEVDLAGLARIPAGLQFQRLLEQAIDDVKRRPGDNRKRKVALQVTITPKVHTETDDDGRTKTHLTGVELGLESKISFPSRGPVAYDCGLAGDRIVLNPDCPYDHKQKVLPCIEGGEVVAVKMPGAG